jgi:hypothetical protein
VIRTVLQAERSVLAGETKACTDVHRCAYGNVELTWITDDETLAAVFDADASRCILPGLTPTTSSNRTPPRQGR